MDNVIFDGTAESNQQAKDSSIFEDTFDVSEFINPISINPGNMKFRMDRLQDMLLQNYIRNSPEFRRAFVTDYTGIFLGYVRDKRRLTEPLNMCMIGTRRGGKSTSGISILGYTDALYGKRTQIKNICADEFEYLNCLKNVLKYEAFLIDEAKLATYGIGSVAKRMKLQDVQNIIAVNCISTIAIRPDQWAAEFAEYGLKCFGRCFEEGINRFLLYNLQESSKGNVVPLGVVYIPIFSKFLTYGKELEKEYAEKKQSWVNEEQHGERDMLFRTRIMQAIEFTQSPVFSSLKKGKERKVWASAQLGSEFTSGEVEEIVTMASMLVEGKLTEQDLLKNVEPKHIKQAENPPLDPDLSGLLGN